MSQISVRTLHTVNSHQEVSDLLQTIFMAEILVPSRELWLVSPWISDIPILDNRANQLLSVEPEWSRTKISFSAVLAKIISLGSQVYVVTNQETHNDAFIKRLQERTDRHRGGLHIRRRPTLHSKGLLGVDYFLHGSMNFTFNGISVTEECLSFFTETSVVADSRNTFRSRYRGEPL